MKTDAWLVANRIGKYHMRVMYKELRGHKPKVPWKHLICSNGVRPKSLFVLWLCSQNRISIKDRLVKFGVRWMENVYFATRDSGSSTV